MRKSTKVLNFFLKKVLKLNESILSSFLTQVKFTDWLISSKSNHMIISQIIIGQLKWQRINVLRNHTFKYNSFPHPSSILLDRVLPQDPKLISAVWFDFDSTSGFFSDLLPIRPKVLSCLSLLHFSTIACWHIFSPEGSVWLHDSSTQSKMQEPLSSSVTPSSLSFQTCKGEATVHW